MTIRIVGVILKDYHNFVILKIRGHFEFQYSRNNSTP